MKEIILTRCGYRCDLCLAFHENVKNNPDYPEIVSDGWHKYFDFRIDPKTICCDGCLSTKKEDLNLIDKDCPVRPCVIEKGLENCSQCDDYICEKLKQRIVTLESKKKKFGNDVPEEDYQRFIRPYENKRRLDGLSFAWP
jgi:hypothetical protein